MTLKDCIKMTKLGFMGTSTDARYRIPTKEMPGRLVMSQEQQENQRNEDLEDQRPISGMSIDVVDSQDVNIDEETLSEMDPEELKTIYIRGLQDNQLWGAYGKNYKSYIKRGQTECERHALCFCPPRILMFDSYKVYTSKFENQMDGCLLRIEGDKKLPILSEGCKEALFEWILFRGRSVHA